MPDVAAFALAMKEMLRTVVREELDKARS